jgi:hypothetical protein
VTLRIVRDEPAQKRERARREPLFKPDEERALRAALKGLRGNYGGWRHLASAMGMSLVTLKNAAHGRVPVSGEVAIRAARAAKKPLEALLTSGPREVAA